MLITNDIPDLIGGVSQQAPLLRFPNQASEQLNCRNSPVAGMSKRPQTNLVARLTAAGELGSMVTHIIQRDSREHYMMAVGNGQLHVWDLEKGFQYPIEGSAAGYLEAGGKLGSAPFKMMTLGDDTYVLNASMPVTMDYSKRSHATTSTAGYTQYKLTFNTSLQHMDGLVTQQERQQEAEYRGAQVHVTGAQLKGTLTVGADAYPYDMDYKTDLHNYLMEALHSKGVAAYSVKDALIITVPDAVKVALTDTSTCTITTSWSERHWHHMHHTTRHCAIQRTEQHALTMLAVYGRTTAAELAKATEAAYVWIRQADYSVNYTVIVNGVSCTISSPEATSAKARAGLNSTTLSGELATAINKTTSKHKVIAQVVDGVIMLRATDGKEMTLTVSDGLYNSALKLCYRTVQTAADLPPSAMVGEVVQVTGEVSDVEAKGYYVTYNSKEHVWEETTARGIANHFNAASMPHMVRRCQDKKYVSKENPFGIYFALQPIEWSERCAGDELSMAVPSFVSRQDAAGNITEPRYITTLSYFRGRLWMLGGDYTVSSVAQDRHNFWRGSAITVVDDDPIDSYIDLKADAETIHSSVPTDRGLLVFTKRGQYLIAAQGRMAPSTFEFKQVSSYSSDEGVEPQPVGDRVTFVTQRSEFAAVYDSYISNDAGTRTAVDISSHVPEYIKGRVHHILSASTINTQFYVMRDFAGNPQSTIYVYDYLLDNGKRAQSAWSKWTFGGEVLDGVLTQDSLYLIIRRNQTTEDGKNTVTQYNIERINLITDPLCNELGHPVYLDCLQRVPDEPKDLVKGEVAKTFKGQWYRGFPYLQLYQFSPFYLRPEGKATGQTGGRLQLRKLTLNFDRTTCYKVAVDTLGRERREVFFQGRVLGDVRNLIGVVPIVNGKRTYPLLGSSESISVSIENDGLFDARFQSAFWEGFYYTRARRA